MQGMKNWDTEKGQHAKEMILRIIISEHLKYYFATSNTILRIRTVYTFQISHLFLRFDIFKFDYGSKQYLLCYYLLPHVLHETQQIGIVFF